MIKSNDRRKYYSNYFNLLKFFIYSCFFIEACSEIVRTNAKTEPEAKSVYPNFFVNGKGVIFANPQLKGLFAQHITVLGKKLHSKLAAKESLRALFLCDTALYEIVSENSWMPQDQIIAEIKNRSIKFILTLPEFLSDPTSMGSYSIKEREIVLSYKQSYGKDHYKAVLLNELFSHLSVKSNQRCNITTTDYQLLSIPFLKKDGTIDFLLMNNFNASITLGLERIAKIKLLNKQRKTAVSSHDMDWLTQSFIAAKSYVPRLYYTSLDTKIDGKKMVSEIIGEYLILHKGYLEPGLTLSGISSFFRGKIIGAYLVSHQTHNTQTCAGKLRALFADLNNSIVSLDKVEGPYQTRIFPHKLSELSSFIVELPKPVMELIFPEFLAILNSQLSKCASHDKASHSIKAKL